MADLRRSLPLLSLSALLSLPAAGQYTARKIVFKNPGGASQAQLETVSGFHAGTRFSTPDLSAAAQKIADTGFYDNVGAAVDGNNNAALTVIFTLTPSKDAEFLPTGFENFVWLTPPEITEAIQAKLPLFNGRLPEAGTQADTAADALAGALRAKGIGSGSLKFIVEHETVEPTLEHPERVMEFRVANPLPIVTNIRLSGVDAKFVPLLQTSVNRTAHTAYNEGKAGFITQEQIVAPLLDAGYAQAILSHMTMEIGSPADGKVPLVLTTTLTPGTLYKVASLTFAGAPLYSAEDFAKTAKLHPGDLASRKMLLETLAPLDQAYRSKGYMDVVVKAEPGYDVAAGTVAYAVSVTPGEPYRLKDVTAEGLDPAAKADFERHFLEHPGDVYNPVYVQGFIKNNTALQSLAPYTGTFKAYAHPDSHTVDLVLTFVRGAGAQTITVR